MVMPMGGWIFGYIFLANAPRWYLLVWGVGAGGPGAPGTEGMGEGDALLGCALKGRVWGPTNGKSSAQVSPASLLSPLPLWALTHLSPSGLPCSHCHGGNGASGRHALAACGRGLLGERETCVLCSSESRHPGFLSPAQNSLLESCSTTRPPT